MRMPDTRLGESTICPVCGKEFTLTDKHSYITGGGYTCSWECFLNKVKERENNLSTREEAGTQR